MRLRAGMCLATAAVWLFLSGTAMATPIDLVLAEEGPDIGVVPSAVDLL